MQPEKVWVGLVLERVGASGSANFIPKFNSRFHALSMAVAELRQQFVELGNKTLLMNLDIDTLQKGGDASTETLTNQ